VSVFIFLQLFVVDAAGAGLKKCRSRDKRWAGDDVILVAFTPTAHQI
ncbi:hypothetical protein AVEN_73731-1, partial [Araneus ventricosus]